MIKLVGDKVEFIGNQKLSTFNVIEYEFEDDDAADGVDVKVNIKLKRQIAQQLLTIYLPSTFIVVIAQVIFFDFPNISNNFQVPFNANIHFYKNRKGKD